MSSSDEIDPRIERSRRVICEATLDELEAVGYGALTISGVARRAGVSKATLYRHWPNKLALVGDAIESLRAADIPRQSGPVVPQIRGFVHALTELTADSRWSGVMPAIIQGSALDPELAAFHCEMVDFRRYALSSLVQTGVDNGELPAGLDVEVAAEMLASPIFYRRLFTPTPATIEYADRVINAVLGV